MVRVQLERGGKIGQRPRPVALLPPQLAAVVERVGERRVQPQRGIVVGNGAIELILAREDGGARDQRLDAVGLRGLLIVDYRSACCDDIVVVIGRNRRKARRGVDRRQLLAGLRRYRERSPRQHER
jgi:hypothetical protein